MSSKAASCMLEHLHKMTGAGWLSSFLSEEGGASSKPLFSVKSLAKSPHRTALQCIVTHGAALLQVRKILPAFVPFPLKTASLFSNTCNHVDSGILRLSFQSQSRNPQE